ncbi:Error-prone, lesion bypass DNA polymerase V (UmuC) [Desulfovibrio sp. DV]|uniref:Y-family DNA polymerase n=1 Tax=Desulfovibrio sp. DV TaxID=1844708 RepID=UPI00094B7F92|nr:Y-family DNA polymerase [Desulfovibrio sp. DV]OLN26906.1 Error-prone, lesion bypass DNA polymerase V (UmuC) [Desulfovibrio sp. DV]
MAATAFALVDCNNFYASCERVFAPHLAGRPVVVLSNNDGCIIARSAEAKALGVPMGQPAFQCRELFARHGIAVFSSNYALYGDMSARVMATLSRFTPAMEVYSIDEAFLDLTGLPGGAAKQARRIRETVVRWTGIPVSVGIGPTKTLAKLANRAAKKHPDCGGVLDFSAHPDPDALLASVPVEDVWGIGRRHGAMLAGRGVLSARAFRDLPREFVRKRMTVQGVHTQLELRGFSCIDLDKAPPAPKTLMSSRSFGRAVTTKDELAEALAEYVSRVAAKLRHRGLLASGMQVYVQTYADASGRPPYAGSAFAAPPAPTDHTATLISLATQALGGLFRPGWRYKKAGVILLGLESRAGRQLSLLDAPAPEAARNERLMAALDAVNAKWGQDTLAPAACGITRPWAMRQEKRSPRYTTDWDELPVARAG